jgi:hypothetical protein
VRRNVTSQTKEKCGKKELRKKGETISVFSDV